MLVLPRPATTLRLTNRLSVTAAPCLVRAQGNTRILRNRCHGRPALWIGGACNKNRPAFELRFRRLVEEVQTELKHDESPARASAREASLASV